MIPVNGITNAAVKEVERPSNTWKIDFEKGRITGKIDNLDAVKQAAFKILETERYRYLIYSFNYGAELEALIGKNPSLVRSETARRIKEALLQDDRIQDITNIDITANGDSIHAKFTVVTNYGSFEAGREVK
ncbi:hypothetical protein OXPF_06090 [Oxobacter pfennigii]|uniref:DUF2634 domain-containing protein n=1 Tax=Oxobacter pfennigii TaxID=36849 RepID=A0A0P9AKE7_9CLOT|nr:DUF2634 domain-containing protein [Oxobacter pfennigii]KPU45820.1 hypothetical protein OXPF_06090 [Oxobacter pfennigii]